MIDQLSMFHEMEKCVVANSYHHKFDFKEIEKNWDSGMIEVIYHSNIMASKGILLLLAAFQKLLKNGHLKINLTITGDFISDYLMNSDDIKARFINKLTEIQEEYPENIHYIGPVDLNQKVEMLNKSHVFVLPTFHKGEAIPLTILEAMRSGLYIITTDHNYLPEIINKTNGELIKPNDLDSLYTSLEHLPSSTSLAEIGENNKVIASQIYSEKLFIDNVADVLNLNGNTCLQRDQ
ncbi:MAG: glycosyltransferase family 4 protein [Cyclobacteriaceae bacterium]